MRVIVWTLGTSNYFTFRSKTWVKHTMCKGELFSKGLKMKLPKRGSQEISKMKDYIFYCIFTCFICLYTAGKKVCLPHKLSVFSVYVCYSIMKSYCWLCVWDSEQFFLIRSWPCEAIRPHAVRLTLAAQWPCAHTVYIYTHINTHLTSNLKCTHTCAYAAPTNSTDKWDQGPL